MNNKIEKMKLMCVHLSTENVDAVLKFIPKVEVKKNKRTHVSFSDVKLEFTTTRWVVVQMIINTISLLLFAHSIQLSVEYSI